MPKKKYTYSLDNENFKSLHSTKTDAFNQFLEDTDNKQETVFFVAEFNKVNFSPKVRTETIMNDINDQLHEISALKHQVYFDQDFDEVKKIKMQKSLTRFLKTWLKKNYKTVDFYTIDNIETYLYKNGQISLINTPKRSDR